MIDVETTGLSPRQHRILELAVVRVSSSGRVVDEWSTRFNPEGPVGATHIHGIRDADVRDAPFFRQLAPRVATLVEGLPVVAHNARFDLAFLRAEFDSAGAALPHLDAICTLEASHRYLPDLDRRRLVDCCAAARVRLQGAHSALGDARATAGLLAHYLERVDGDPTRLLAAAPSRSLSGARPTARRTRPVRIAPPKRTPPPLLSQISAPTLLDLLDEGAPAQLSTYLESLLEALEDGALTAGEREALAELAELYDLDRDDLGTAHKALVLAAAHRAVEDGRVSRDETAQLRQLAELLDQPEGLVRSTLDEADAAREATITATLRPLPRDWVHGQALHIGDRIAFTGCDERWRTQMEARATKLGVRVTSSVSRKTSLLVTDGSFAGTKLDAARQFGTRIVDPRVFKILLDNLQPRESKDAPPRDEEETLAPAPVSSPLEAGAVRAWARSQGIPVGDRGRLSTDLIEAYRSR